MNAAPKQKGGVTHAFLNLADRQKLNDTDAKPTINHDPGDYADFRQEDSRFGEHGSVGNLFVYQEQRRHFDDQEAILKKEEE